jgi:hypothetical protein
VDVDEEMEGTLIVADRRDAEVLGQTPTLGAPLGIVMMVPTPARVTAAGGAAATETAAVSSRHTIPVVVEPPRFNTGRRPRLFLVTSSPVLVGRCGTTWPVWAKRPSMPSPIR